MKIECKPNGNCMEIEGYFIDFRARVLNPQILPSSEEKCDKKSFGL